MLLFCFFLAIVKNFKTNNFDNKNNIIIKKEKEVEFKNRYLGNRIINLLKISMLLLTLKKVLIILLFLLK